MMSTIIQRIKHEMNALLSEQQLIKLDKTLSSVLCEFEFIEKNKNTDTKDYLQMFLYSKSLEGRSTKTISYYKATITKALSYISKNITHITTEDLRNYMVDYKSMHNSTKMTIDNMRRILSSFFNWLEDEDYIIKSPMRRIHKVKIGQTVKETYLDEELENIRDNCKNPRDLAIVDLLASTGMRIGELVLLDKKDIDFNERECIVFGKGDKERIVYFDARTKRHLISYLQTRKDSEHALFVSLCKPFKRISIGGIEQRLRNLGKILGIKKLHPHKFRRTLATMAIDKGMPIEQLQRLLGHQRIDTTLQYAMVKQNNVKLAHKKYIS